jgi:hypothetical protein
MLPWRTRACGKSYGRLIIHSQECFAAVLSSVSQADPQAGVIQTEEQVLARQFIPYADAERLDRAVLHRHSWSQAMPFNLVLGPPSENGI